MLSLDQKQKLQRPGSAAEGTSPAVPSTVDTGTAIARMLVKSGYISTQQLRYAGRIKDKLSTPKTLISILKELKYINDEQIKETLSANPSAFRLGDLLVELGFLQTAELETAIKLQEQGRQKKKIGQILVEQGFVNAKKIAEVLAYQLGIPYIDLQTSSVDVSLIDKSQVKLFRNKGFLPLGKQDGHFLVAFTDPFDTEGRDIAEKLFGKQLLPAIVTEPGFQQAITFIERKQRAKHGTTSNADSAVEIVNVLLTEAIRQQASDIHIEPTLDRLRVRFRQDGIMIHHKDYPLALAPTITSRIKILAEADISEKRRHQGGRFLWEDPDSGSMMDLRASFYVTLHGEKIVLRLLNKQDGLLDINEIGIAPAIFERFRYDALDVPSGVLIITGPTGSGKTTTLYSCIRYLNDIHTSIITAEDPVEYIIEGISQCSINPKINVTFDETLRHIVRQDPDVIVLGEIRDIFSAETAIQAALTGHKVLTTFHTEDSIGGLLRLMNMNIEAFMISSTVVCVVAQRLLRKVCQNCARPYQPTPLDLRRLGFDKNDLAGFDFKVGTGCEQCRYMGTRGRVGIFEILVLNEMVKDAILNRKTSYEIRRISIETSGLVTLVEDGLMKAAHGEIALEDVIRRLPRVLKPRPIRELQRLTGVI